MYLSSKDHQLLEESFTADLKWLKFIHTRTSLESLGIKCSFYSSANLSSVTAIQLSVGMGHQEKNLKSPFLPFSC